MAKFEFCRLLTFFIKTHAIAHFFFFEFVIYHTWIWSFFIDGLWRGGYFLGFGRAFSASWYLATLHTDGCCFSIERGNNFKPPPPPPPPLLLHFSPPFHFWANILRITRRIGKGRGKGEEEEEEEELNWNNNNSATTSMHTHTHMWEGRVGEDDS